MLGRNSNAQKMGKKGGWFSSIKRVFTHNSKEKLINGSDKTNCKEKKKGRGLLRAGDAKSFIFREPSSIEKILGEADQLFIRAPASSEEPNTPRFLVERPKSPQVAPKRNPPPKVPSPKAQSPRATSPKIVSPPRVFTPGAGSSKASPRPPPKVTRSQKEISYAPNRNPPPKVTSPKAQSPRATSPRAISPPRVFTPGAGSSKAPPQPPPKVTQSRKEISYTQRPEPTLRYRHLSATKIQAAYRGYQARRSLRAVKGLVRLQGVMRGQNVKRQTMNAMKQMQLLVRVQTQVQSRRIQMLENQALQRQTSNELESTMSKMSQRTGTGDEDWNDSSLTKEEVDERLRKKVEAVIKRERAMAYAYSNQLWKSNTKSAQSPLDMRSNGYPWWWNWLERQLPPTTTTSHIQAPTVRNFASTPSRPTPEPKPSPSSPYKHKNFASDNQESLTPRSSKSHIPFRAKQFQTPNQTPGRASPRTISPSFTKYSKPRANSTYAASIKDDDSLMSCPPFSRPNYMTPTLSAAAKVRANSNPKERFGGTPGNDSKRRFSFPLTPWSKGPNKDSGSQIGSEKHRSPRSIGDRSVDSTFSMPAMVGRKPFNRFV